MPKVLIVGESPRDLPYPLLVLPLQALGIEYAIAYSNDLNTNVSTPAGSFAANSNDLRNYFRMFDAVLVIDRREWTSTLGVRGAVRWLNWNDPADPPIVYLGWHFSVAVAQYNGQLPSDFPLIRPDAANQSNTLALLEGGAEFNSVAPPRWGTAVRLLRENATILYPAMCAFGGSPTRGAYWRYNATLHSALANQPYTHAVAVDGRAGEILAVPDETVPPNDNYPANTVAGYRYYNRFFLPMTTTAAWRSSVAPIYYTSPTLEGYLFWLFYGLKLCGVQPPQTIPIQMETDHPIQSIGPRPPSLTSADEMRIHLHTFDYVRDFGRQTGLVVCNGFLISRDRIPTVTFNPWWLLNDAPEPTRTLAQQLLQTLIAGHREGTTPCGVHDHSFGDGNGYGHRRSGGIITFVRHSDAGYLYSAPNDVPIRHGACCIAKHVLPQGAAGADARETTIGDETFVEWNFTGRMSGTGATLSNLNYQNVHAARIIIESEIAEMKALGFPDGHCGDHKYTNTANNSAGGIAYWQAAQELGLKALRSGYCVNENIVTPSDVGSYNQTVPPYRIWRGFHLLPHMGLDFGAWGLYDPSNSGNAVQAWGLNSVGGDIIGQWSSNRHTAAWRAHRRATVALTHRVLANCMQLVIPWWHPAMHWYGASTTQTTARFEGENILNASGQPHWNPTVELLENLRGIVSVLAGYLKFGSISDLIVLRERVLT